MISVARAQEQIAQRAVPLDSEAVSLERSYGRILREPVLSPEDLPPFDRSAMDGYVMRSGDPAKEWEIIGEIRAGETIDAEIHPGQAMRIFTGARLPGPGLQVVMQEDVEATPPRIRLLRRGTQSHVRRRGEDARKGEVLLQPGMRLDAPACALLASMGKTSVLVSREPRILHITTGDEIVPADQTPGPGQIRNSNGPLIRALCREWGGETTHLHAPDQLERTIELVAEARPKSFDLILVSGGSGSGKYDFTGELLRALGVEIDFRQVDVRPGKPLIFGASSGQLFFGLPGNAMSHFVCFHLFVRVALAGLLGRRPASPVSAFVAELVSDTDNSRETWWPVRTRVQEGRVEVRALPWKSSGDITRLPGADALIKVPAGTPQLLAGTQVECLWLRSGF